MYERIIQFRLRQEIFKIFIFFWVPMFHFCYQRKSALVKGKGEIILPLKKAIPQYHAFSKPAN